MDLMAFVEIQLGSRSPNLSELKGTLVAYERVMAQLIVVPTEDDIMPQDSDSEDLAPVSELPESAPAKAGVASSSWKNRKDRKSVV